MAMSETARSQHCKTRSVPQPGSRRSPARQRMAVMTFHTSLLMSIALTAGGFITPPVGVIDGSVISSVGLLLMFNVVAQIPAILDAANDGRRISLQKGDFKAELASHDE